MKIAQMVLFCFRRIYSWVIKNTHRQKRKNKQECCSWSIYKQSVKKCDSGWYKRNVCKTTTQVKFVFVHELWNRISDMHLVIQTNNEIKSLISKPGASSHFLFFSGVCKRICYPIFEKETKKNKLKNHRTFSISLRKKNSFFMQQQNKCGSLIYLHNQNGLIFIQSVTFYAIYSENDLWFSDTKFLLSIFFDRCKIFSIGYWFLQRK